MQATEVIKHNHEKPSKYPYLGISKSIEQGGSGLGQIVLFTDPRTGTNVNGRGYPIGNYSDAWCEDDFEPYNGVIQLQNSPYNQEQSS